jgi:hypothetical protein
MAPDESLTRPASAGWQNAGAERRSSAAIRKDAVARAFIDALLPDQSTDGEYDGLATHLGWHDLNALVCPVEWEMVKPSLRREDTDTSLGLRDFALERQQIPRITLVIDPPGGEFRSGVLSAAR